MKNSPTALIGVDDQQKEEPGEVFSAEARGCGLDYVHDDKLEPGEGEEC